MKKMIILSCLAFITLSALGLNAYLKGAKKTKTHSTVPTTMEEVTEEFVKPQIELKEKEKKSAEAVSPKKVVEEKKDLNKAVPQVEKKAVQQRVDKKQVEQKVVESDMPPAREVLESDADDSALAVVDEVAELKEVGEVPELALEHFGRASLKQPREKHLKKKDKVTAKVSKKEERKKRKKFGKK